MRDIVRQKLIAFDAIQSATLEGLRLIEEMHGQRRFARVTLDDIGRYLHALWLADCKDRLLSVPKTIERYEGVASLRLLGELQRGEVVATIAFLHAKLDGQPFDQLSQQVLEAEGDPQQRAIAARLRHGRQNLLNRAFNQLRAFDALFAPHQHDLATKMQAICAELGHTPAALEQQIAAFADPLYNFIPAEALARRNMQIMNLTGVTVTENPADAPGNRTARVEVSVLPGEPYADTPIPGYRELTSPQYNNPRHTRFVDRPDTPDAGIVVGEEPVPSDNP